MNAVEKAWLVFGKTLVAALVAARLEAQVGSEPAKLRWTQVCAHLGAVLEILDIERPA